MLILLGIAREDGWAFVRDEDRILLVRPPYQTSTRTQVSQATVARAIGDAGFSPSDQVFGGWTELIDHVREELVRAAQERGPSLAKEELGRAMLKNALPGMLDRLLQQVEVEMIPKRQIEPAERLLADMLALSPRLKQDPARLDRATKLLQAVQALRDERAQTLRALHEADRPRRFPRLGDRAGLVAELGRRIALNHQLLATYP